MPLSTTNRKLLCIFATICCHVVITFAVPSALRSNTAIDKTNSSKSAPDRQSQSCGNCIGIDCCYMQCCGCLGTSTEPVSTTIEWGDETTTEDCPQEQTCVPCDGGSTFGPCPTEPPCSNDDRPKFSKSFYQSSLPSWPSAGTTVHLGLNATTADNMPLRYQLVTSFEYLTLSAANDIIFTNNVSEGAYVGPNNVMVIEVVATVVWDESRKRSSTIIIVFPHSVTTNNPAVG